MPEFYLPVLARACQPTIANNIRAHNWLVGMFWQSLVKLLDVWPVERPRGQQFLEYVCILPRTASTLVTNYNYNLPAFEQIVSLQTQWKKPMNRIQWPFFYRHLPLSS